MLTSLGTPRHSSTHQQNHLSKLQYTQIQLLFLLLVPVSYNLLHPFILHWILHSTAKISKYCYYINSYDADQCIIIKIINNQNINATQHDNIEWLSIKTTAINNCWPLQPNKIESDPMYIGCLLRMVQQLEEFAGVPRLDCTSLYQPM